jgi:hypothetical protein
LCNRCVEMLCCPHVWILNETKSRIPPKKQRVVSPISFVGWIWKGRGLLWDLICWPTGCMTMPGTSDRNIKGTILIFVTARHTRLLRQNDICEVKFLSD